MKHFVYLISYRALRTQRYKWYQWRRAPHDMIGNLELNTDQEIDSIDIVHSIQNDLSLGFQEAHSATYSTTILFIHLMKIVVEKKEVAKTDTPQEPQE